MIQSVFSSSPHNALVTCKVCGMSYERASERDQSSHKKYHHSFVHGPLFDERGLELLKTSRVLLDHESFECNIYAVPKDIPRAVRKAESILEMVNQELNAPQEHAAWKEKSSEMIEGKAFIIIINKRAVALCATEPITNAEKQTRWMVHRTQVVVPKQINKKSKLGISRIWVATQWRRKGLGMLMLEAAMRHSVYGMVLHKSEIAFSQPSYSGGLLARRFCGVTHKSGEILVPIYIEDA